jgi:hypothetical protein
MFFAKFNTSGYEAVPWFQSYPEKGLFIRCDRYVETLVSTGVLQKRGRVFG